MCRLMFEWSPEAMDACIVSGVCENFTPIDIRVEEADERDDDGSGGGSQTFLPGCRLVISLVTNATTLPPAVMMGWLRTLLWTMLVGPMVC